nr:HSP=56 kda major heat shock protein {N-terminal} [Helicobacter pylori, ATCC43504, Peptide Partial, 20 aa] [Helicobacter pylori]
MQNIFILMTPYNLASEVIMP